MAAGTLTTDYASQNVGMVWNGIRMEAYADSFVSISFVEEQTVATQSPDGSVSYSLLPATMGTIEVTLQQESPTHGWLTAVLAAQKSGIGIIRGTFVVENLEGNSLYTGINASIQSPPTVAYGKTHEEGLRTWVFHCADLKIAG